MREFAYKAWEIIVLLDVILGLFGGVTVLNKKEKTQPVKKNGIFIACLFLICITVSIWHIKNDTVIVPKVLGTSIDNAIQTLREQGLEDSIIGTVADAINMQVEFQNPREGTYVKKGTKVHLKSKPEDYSGIKDTIVEPKQSYQLSNDENTTSIITDETGKQWSCQVFEYDYLKGNVVGEQFTRTYISSEPRCDENGKLKTFYKYNECTLVNEP